MLEMFKGKPNERMKPKGGNRDRGVSVMPVALTQVVASIFTALSTVRNLVYLVAIIGFILALKGLGLAEVRRQGNQLGAAAAILAVAITFTLPSLRHADKNLILALVAMVLARPLPCRSLARCA